VKVGNRGSVVLGGHSTHKDGIEVKMYPTNIYCMELKECMGNARRRLVYIVLVLSLARAAKQIMSWAAQISLSSCRLLTSHWALTMAGCMVQVD
jgi:hypothetical protein